MLQRRVVWAALAVGSFGVFGGCRGEAGGDQSASANGVNALNGASGVTLSVVPSKRAAQLLEHVASTFRLKALRVAMKKNKKAAGAAPTVPMLAPSPITQFTLDGEVIRPVLPAPAKNTPIPTIGLPKTADGAVTMSISGLGIEVRPRGFSPVSVEWSDHVAVYPDAISGTHVYRRVDARGIEDFYEVATPRDVVSFTYDVTLKGVAGLRLVGMSLELLDASGTPRLATTAPVVVDAKGVRRIGQLAVTGCAYDTNENGPWGRPVTNPGSATCVVTASVDARGLAFPVLVDPAWRPTFDSRQTHQYHKTLSIPAGVDAGKVLLVGGDGSAPVTTELFDPATNSWADAGSIPDATGLAEGCNAAVLSDGTVVLAGGFAAGGSSNAKQTTVKRGPTATTPRWTYGGSMNKARAWYAMGVVTVGGKQQVLAAGGQPTDDAFDVPPLKSAELYDPSTDTWTNTAAMNHAHARAGYTTLTDGKLLVVGGYSTDDTATAFNDVFNPTTGTWLAAAATPAMATDRGAPIVVATATGAVVFGGFDDSFGDSLDSIEYWNGSVFTTLTAKLSEARAYGAGVVLDDGRLLIAGGQGNVDDGTGSLSPGALDSADIFSPGTDPTTGTLVSTASMETPRRWHALTNIVGKGALATGGEDGTSAVKQAEIFDTTLGRACGASTPACPSGTFCTEGVCCEKAACAEGLTCATPGHEGLCTKPLGSTCTTGSECATGHCADGYCCDTACTGECSTCNVAGKLGTCSLAPEGTDPKGLCLFSGEDPGCGSACDGAGSCFFYPPAGTPCSTSGGDASTDTGLFCKHYSCDGSGTCGLNTFDCGLTCVTAGGATCDEATKTCSAGATGIKAGYCVIESACYSYGDINPKNSCEACDPTATGSKTSWSVAAACKEAGVDDAGVDTNPPSDTGAKDSGAKDTGIADTSSASDTGATSDSTIFDDAGSPEDLPTQAACSCEMPGNARGPSYASGLALALAGLAIARRQSSKSKRA